MGNTSWPKLEKQKQALPSQKPRHDWSVPA
jgi:hypothetical protein